MTKPSCGMGRGKVGRVHSQPYHFPGLCHCWPRPSCPRLFPTGLHCSFSPSLNLFQEVKPQPWPWRLGLLWLSPPLHSSTERLCHHKEERCTAQAGKLSCGHAKVKPVELLQGLSFCSGCSLEMGYSRSPKRVGSHFRAGWRLLWGGTTE